MVASKRAPLLVGSGALLLLGAGLLIWHFVVRSQSGQSLPAGARAIPLDSPLVVSLSTDLRQWQRLRQYGTADTQAEFDQLLVQWRDRLFTDGGIDFAEDIQPWVGSEITLAFLPTTTAEPGTALLPAADLSQAVALLPIVDLEAAQAVLETQGEGQSENQDQAQIQPEAAQTYQGIDIFDFETEAASPVYGAVLGPNLLAVSSQPRLLERTIDAYKSNSLADRPGLTAAFGRLEGADSFARFYVDMPTVVTYLVERSQPPLGANPTAFAGRGLVGVVELEPQGIRTQSVSWLESGSSFTFDASAAGAIMPQQLPAKTLLMASTSNFQSFWQSFQRSDTLGALVPLSLPDLALGLEGATGLNVEEDVLPWLEGEFALGILAPDAVKPAADAEDEAAESLPNPAIVAVAQVGDRPAAERTFSQLDRVMGDRYGFAINNQTLEDQPLTRWVSPLSGLSFSHGWLQENLTFLTVGQGVAEALVESPSLAGSGLFQMTTRSAPTRNNGYFFIDLKGINSAEGSLLLPPLPADGWIGSQALTAIGVTATVLDERQVRYDLFVALNRGPNPGSLPKPETEAPGGTGEAAPDDTADNDDSDRHDQQPAEE